MVASVFLVSSHHTSQKKRDRGTRFLKHKNNLLKDITYSLRNPLYTVINMEEAQVQAINMPVEVEGGKATFIIIHDVELIECNLSHFR